MQEPTQTERALLRVARTLAAATDVEEITTEITRTVVELTGALGAYVERVISSDGLVMVIANAGEGSPPYGTRVPYPGSLTEEIIESGEPLMMDTLIGLGKDMAPYLSTSCTECAGIVVPLLSEGDVVGTLVLLRRRGEKKFDERDANIARLLGDLASVALRRVTRAHEVQERQERFQSLAENAAEAIVSIDSHDRIHFANPAAERIFGYTHQELLQANFTSLIPERFRAAHREGMQRYIESGTRRIKWDGMELTGLRKDGGEIPLDVTFGEFRRGDERFFTGVMRDMSDRKRVEEERDRLFARESSARAKAESEERHARFLATASIMLSSSLDVQTTLQSLANLAIQAVADWCVIDAMTPKGIERVAGAHNDTSKQPLMRELAEKFPPEPGSSHPAVLTMRGGDPVIVNDISPQQLRGMARSDEHAQLVARLGIQSLMSVPLSMSGEVLGVITLVRGPASGNFQEDELVFVQDLASRAALAISNSRHYADAETARADAELDRQALEKAIESKARLIRGFSHDIKNPLGAADGYAQLLIDGLMGDLTPKQLESLGRIRTAIATALGLINDVVEFSRAETGQIEVRPVAFNTDALVREVVAEHKAAADNNGACLKVGALEGGRLTCDATRIRQILANLVSNAIKYGGQGDIIVSVERDEAEHSRVLFSVRDNGSGIPVEKQHLLFEEFTRLHTGKKEGSGLGLAISRRIARVLGGDINVDSADGRGSTFTLWLPAPRSG